MSNIKTCPTHHSEMPCRECVLEQHHRDGGRHKIKSDPREPEPFYVPKLSPKATHAERVDFLERLAKDPARVAGLQAMLRKPVGVSKTRHALALHRREPMLNARPEAMKRSLAYKDAEGSPKLRKGDRRGRLIVTANSLQASRYGGRAGFWGERLWTVYSTEYGRGFFIQTDEGHHTASFPTIGELKSAITQSGWRIVRSINV